MPKGGIAPSSTPWNREANSASSAASAMAPPAASRRRLMSTFSVARTTAITIVPSTFTMTVLASSRPGMWADSAISWAV